GRRPLPRWATSARAPTRLACGRAPAGQIRTRFPTTDKEPCDEPGGEPQHRSRTCSALDGGLLIWDGRSDASQSESCLTVRQPSRGRARGPERLTTPFIASATPSKPMERTCGCSVG